MDGGASQLLKSRRPQIVVRGRGGWSESNSRNFSRPWLMRQRVSGSLWLGIRTWKDSSQSAPVQCSQDLHETLRVPQANDPRHTGPVGKAASHKTGGVNCQASRRNKGEMGMPSTQQRLCSCATTTLLAIVVSCGPSNKDLEQAREADRQRAVAASREALIHFAERHRATPVELLEMDPLSRIFTAQLQQQLEGNVIAFQAGLLDIVRTPAKTFEAVFGSPFLGGTVVTLSTDGENAAKLLTHSRLSNVLVVARIDRVEAMTLKLEPCGEVDCTEVKLEPNLLGTPHRISGSLIAAK